MRITNKMLSDNFLRDMSTNLNNLSTIQTQMSSGNLIQKPSDDPAKASKIMQLNSEINANTQYNTNITNTSNWLDTTDTSLGQVGDDVSRIQELLQSAGNGTYTSDEQIAVKDEINQRVGEISQILNTSYDGKYIFAGTSGTTKPTSATEDSIGNTQLINNIMPKALTKLISTGPASTVLTYAGTTVASGSTFNMTINGTLIPVTTTSAITSGKTTMADVAATLQTNINTAITTANTAITADNATNNKTTALITAATVTATNNGGYTITPADTMTFSDNPGSTVTKDLGLSEGSNKLSVEVSQGVTTDYNITASQVINYGTGDNNLMKLLSNITSHLDSTDPATIALLTTDDLTGIQNAMTNITSLRSEVGAKQNAMTSTQTRNGDQSYNLTSILSTTQDIDVTEKAMEYASLQNVYTASLQTGAKIIQPTLLDYLT